MDPTVRDLLRSAYPARETNLDLKIARLCLRLKRASVVADGGATPIDGAMPQMPNPWRASTPMAGWP